MIISKIKSKTTKTISTSCTTISSISTTTTTTHSTTTNFKFDDHARARDSQKTRISNNKKRIFVVRSFFKKKIQTYRKKLNELTLAQRTLFSLFSFSHLSNLYVVVAFIAQSIETRTNFLHMTHESKYFKMKKTFVNVSFRFLQNVYHDRLNVRNFSKFIFF